jgi:nucleotide-binding universal stress UspA family protein
MTYRTIMAAASGGSASDGAIELACRFAQRFGAHLEAYHVRLDARGFLAYSGGGFGGPMAGEFMDRFAADAAEIAARTRASFEATIARHQIPQVTVPSPPSPAANAASAGWNDEAGNAPALVSRRARFFDLAVLGRSDRVMDEPYSDVVEQTLIHSGRPVLLAPATPPEALGEAVAIGWNGSAQATRAMIGAMPFLAGARSVFVITVGEQHRDGAQAVIEYLAWHNIKGQHRHMPTIAGVGPGQQLLSSAREAGADLLVMGGYGQTPWRELLFGGATRQVVGVSLLPVLLAH